MSYSTKYLKKRADELYLVPCSHNDCEFCDKPSLGMYCRPESDGDGNNDVAYIVCGYCMATGFDINKQEIKLPF